jgi:hypothetical protein
VHPVLQVAHLCNIREFELLSKIDIIRVFSDSVQSFRRDLTAMSDTGQLALQQVLFETSEFRIGFYLCLQISSEDVLDLFGSFNLFRCN